MCQISQIINFILIIIALNIDELRSCNKNAFKKNIFIIRKRMPVWLNGLRARPDKEGHEFESCICQKFLTVFLWKKTLNVAIGVVD